MILREYFEQCLVCHYLSLVVKQQQQEPHLNSGQGNLLIICPDPHGTTVTHDASLRLRLVSHNGSVWGSQAGFHLAHGFAQGLQARLDHE
jgi:hypothetical protein